MTWDPTAYELFADERARPFVDLLRRAQDARGEHAATGLVVDLGCGTGERTLLLARTWPTADVLGVDSSAEMLTAARTLAASGGADVRFEAGDVRTWRRPGTADVIVTNAVLQWVPGHGDLLPRLVDSLAPGGVLGLQVPGNADAPSHRLLRQTVTDGPWAHRLRGLLDSGPTSTGAVHTPLEYDELLRAAGCERVDAWESTYVQLLDPPGRHGDDAVLRFVSGTALRPFLTALTDDEERQAFIDDYAARLRDAYPRRDHGTPFPFRRIFAVGRRAGHALA